jgi:uncharacterized membrane protein SirB2
VYTALKHVHVACVVLSFTGFVLRFGLGMAGSKTVTHPFARTAPHVNDTLLLAAAIGMLVLGDLTPLDHPWLLAKFAGLLAYIVCGSLALRRARSPAGRIAAFAAALASFGFVASAAVTKSAWGLLAS